MTNPHIEEQVAATKAEARLLKRIAKRIELVTESGCWIWTGDVFYGSGYATERLDGKRIRVHRWLYQKLYGDIGNLVLDHLCRVRCCINPAHLEPVPDAVNILRGTSFSAINAAKKTCPNGHPYDRVHKDNYHGGLRRVCSICKRDRWNAWNKERVALRALRERP